MRRATPPQPGERTHTHAALRRRRSTAGCVASHRARPSSRSLLTSCTHTPQPAPGCVAHKHTQRVPHARGRRGARRYRGPQTARARHAFLFRDTHAMPTHNLAVAHDPPPCAAHHLQETPAPPAPRVAPARLARRGPLLLKEQKKHVGAHPAEQAGHAGGVDPAPARRLHGRRLPARHALRLVVFAGRGLLAGCDVQAPAVALGTARVELHDARLRPDAL